MRHGTSLPMTITVEKDSAFDILSSDGMIDSAVQPLEMSNNQIELMRDFSQDFQVLSIWKPDERIDMYLWGNDRIFTAVRREDGVWDTKFDPGSFEINLEAQEHNKRMTRGN